MTEFADGTVDYEDPESTNIPTDAAQVVQFQPPVELDIDAMVAKYGDDPKALALAIQHYYTVEQFQSTSSIILIQRGDGLWVVFEGLINVKTHKFTVVHHIADFKPNVEHGLVKQRAPNVAVNMAVSCGIARQIPVWLV